MVAEPAPTTDLLDDFAVVETILTKNFWHNRTELNQLNRDRHATCEGSIGHPNWEDYGPFRTLGNGRCAFA